MSKLPPFLLVFAFLVAPAIAADPASLPIRRVVLYKHGVGYFERRGAIQGNGQVSLRFKLGEMSDVLKSLTVLDRSGGKVAAIAYDSQKPTSEILSEFAFDLRANDIQLAMLQQLRGAHVAIEVAGRGKITGAVLGIDTRTRDGNAKTTAVPALSLFTDSGEIVTAEMFDLTSLTFTDPALAADLQRYLATLRTAQRRDEKMVELVCEGAGERDLFASYTVEQPVWKASYRLVLLDDRDKPLLQGWAIVDNTSDEDWVDVDLSLVAGLPVAFRHDLYTPRRVERPLLTVNEQATASLDALSAGFESAGEVADAESGGKPRTGGMFAGRGKPTVARLLVESKADAAPEPGERSELATNALSFGDALDSQQAESVTREIGDLLEYKIDHQVTIPRNRSAMLQIVKAPVDGSRVALYREAARATNPMSAIRLVNSSGVALEGGPLTVLEGETYSGEAYLDSLKPSELRYVPFAVELGIKAESKLDSKREHIHRIVIKNGVMYSSYDLKETKVYTFTNNELAARRVVVEHAKRNGYKLVEPKSAEDELALYRFNLDLDAGKTGTVTVIETFEQSDSVRVGDLTNDWLTYFEGQGVLNDSSRKFLTSVLAQKGAIADSERDIQRNNTERDAIFADQERIRGHLPTLRSSDAEKELRKTYLEQLKTGEEQIRALRDALAALQTKLTTQQSDLAKLLSDFTLDYVVR